MPSTIKQTAIRFTEDDLALIAALREKLGLLAQSDVLRMALRALADRHDVSVKKSAKSAKGNARKSRAT